MSDVQVVPGGDDEIVVVSGGKDEMVVVSKPRRRGPVRAKREDVTVESKRCTSRIQGRACGRTLPAAAFNLMWKSDDGLHSICRECDRRHTAAYRARVKAGRIDSARAEATHKVCGGPCGEVKARSEFHANPQTPDGLRSQCRNCYRERRCEHDRAYRARKRAERDGTS